MDHTWSNCP